MSASKTTLLTLLCSLIVVGLSTLQVGARKKNTQIQYQSAGVAAPTAADPNSTTVRTSSGSKRTVAQQTILTLAERKVELQAQQSRLGKELPLARRSQAKKISKELETVSSDIEVINRKIASMPKSVRDGLEGDFGTVAELHDTADSLFAARERAAATPVRPQVEEPEDEEESEYQQPSTAQSSAVTYRVQLSVVSRPNPSAFAGMSNVKEIVRPDGKYAYYYGSYSTLSEAQAACKRLRASSKFRDAFVVALAGNRRITLDEAARLGR